MRKVLIAALVTATAYTAISPIPAAARDGNVAAGIIGGLAVGTILGAAASGPRYYAPAPVYVEPAVPAYVERECYWTRGAPEWDEYRGIWYRPRMRVCD